MCFRGLFLFYSYSGFNLHLTTWQYYTDLTVASGGSSGQGCPGEGGEEEELGGGDPAWLVMIPPGIRDGQSCTT